MNFLISAGPTREYIDAVRYLSNASSGRMGIELAKAAARGGHSVRLVHGPCSVHLPKSRRIKRYPVVSAGQMHKALRGQFYKADVLIMAAAVSDFAPARRHAGKPAKADRRFRSLPLKRNADIVADLARRKRADQFVVGFSVGTGSLALEARRKMRRKGLDMIVANLARDGLGTEFNKVTVIEKSEKKRSLPRMQKGFLADRLIRIILSVFRSNT